MLGAAAKLAVEHTLMMPPPPPARRRGVNTWQPCTTPHILTPITQCQSSMEISPTGLPPAPTPALLITRVGASPNHSWARSARASTCSSRDTSQGTARAWPPCSWIASAVAVAVAGLRSLHTTRPPRRASSSANARPIPLPAPVTTARLPLEILFLVNTLLLSIGANLAELTVTLINGNLVRLIVRIQLGYAS